MAVGHILRMTVSVARITITKSHMLVSKLRSSKTKAGPSGLVRVSLFWKSRCVTSSPAYVILYHVTGSCKGPIQSTRHICRESLYLYSSSWTGNLFWWINYHESAAGVSHRGNWPISCLSHKRNGRMVFSWFPANDLEYNSDDDHWITLDRSCNATYFMVGSACGLPGRAR